MQLSLSAGGSPEQVRSSLKHQIETQTAHASDAEKDVAEKVRYYVESKIPDDTETVSVSVSLWIGVTPTKKAETPPEAPADSNEAAEPAPAA